MLTANAVSDCLTSPPSSAARAKAEFFICLARAFEPMRTPAARAAFAQDLAGDLAELAAVARYDVDGALARLEASAAESHDQLLEDYGQLFLVPPVPAPLNAGLYLDGSLMGRATQAMLERYREAGLAPDERFRDLPDHVSMQLEYVAVMFARAAEGDAKSGDRARRFLVHFVLAWLPAFREAVRRAEPRVPAARAYGALAEILEFAARHETLDDAESE